MTLIFYSAAGKHNMHLSSVYTKNSSSLTDGEFDLQLQDLQNQPSFSPPLEALSILPSIKHYSVLIEQLLLLNLPRIEVSAMPGPEATDLNQILPMNQTTSNSPPEEEEEDGEEGEPGGSFSSHCRQDWRGVYS